MKHPVRILAALTSIMLHGLVISIQAANIVSVNYTPESNGMLPEEMAGAPGVRVPNWNNAMTAGSSTTLDLAEGSIIDHTGNVVNGLSISLFTGNAGSTTQRGNPPGGTAPALENDGRMLRTVTDKFEGADGLITVTGIPYAKYHLYFYVYPDAGGGGERGGYFTMTDSAGAAHARWLKGGTGANATVALPNSATGEGYLQSMTTSQPASFADIQAGHYVVITDLTDPNIEVHYSAVGAGAGGVGGGDGVRRLKFSGFQIVEAASGTLTRLELTTTPSSLYSGNPAGFNLPVVGAYSDGSTVPLSTLPGVTYTSSNTNIFTVSTNGLILPGQPGAAQVRVFYQNLALTQEVTVIGPVAVRPVISVDPIYAGTRNLQVSLLADFPDGRADVDVTRYQGVSFSGGNPGIAAITSDGLLTALGEGTFILNASYAGVTGQIEGLVLSYDAPQPEGGKVAVSFNIQNGRAMAISDLAGAPGVRVGFWNNIAGLRGNLLPVVLSPGSIVDSSGKFANNMRVSITGGTSTAAGVSTRGGQSGNESTMFNDVYDQFNGTPGSIEISGIPFSEYDAYFYVISGDADNRPGHFTIGNETRWILDSTGIGIPDNEGNSYVEAISTNTPASVSEVQPGNYVKFSNLSGPALSVQFVADGADRIPDADGAAPRLKFSGFQLVGKLATVRPRLAVSRTGASSLLLSWPVSASGYELKSAAILNGVWSAVNGTPVVNGDKLEITLPLSGAGAFFILQLP